VKSGTATLKMPFKCNYDSFAGVTVYELKIGQIFQFCEASMSRQASASIFGTSRSMQRNVLQQLFMHHLMTVNNPIKVVNYP